jgi:hypothetical protein
MLLTIITSNHSSHTSKALVIVTIISRYSINVVCHILCYSCLNFVSLTLLDRYLHSTWETTNFQRVFWAANNRKSSYSALTYRHLFLSITRSAQADKLQAFFQWLSNGRTDVTIIPFVSASRSQYSYCSSRYHIHLQGKKRKTGWRSPVHH